MAKQKENDMERQIKSEQRAAVSLTNDSTDCYDCAFNPYDDNGMRASCMKYKTKPLSVIQGGSCKHYQKEADSDNENLIGIPLEGGK